MLRRASSSPRSAAAHAIDVADTAVVRPGNPDKQTG